MRILLVEDEQKTGDYLKQGFELAGFYLLIGYDLAFQNDASLIYG